MFAHSYSKLSRTCCGESTPYALQKSSVLRWLQKHDDDDDEEKSRVSSSRCNIVPDRSVHSGIGDDRSLLSIHSSSRSDLMILRSRLSRYGSHNTTSLFVVLQLGIVYQQPFETSSSSSCFCSHLKTELFCRAHGVNSL